MTPATPTFRQIKAQVAAIRQKMPQAQVIGIRTPGRWTGETALRDGDLHLCIYQCDSPLAMRLALREDVAPEAAKVLLTNLDERDLSTDILVRLTRRKLYQIDHWQIVRSLFQARTVDSRLTRHGWIADTLLDLVPTEDYPSARGGYLDAETVWPLLLRHSLGLTAESPDITALLKWSVNADAVSEFRRQSQDFREGAIEWLTERAGQTAETILQCALRLELADALPVGLAAGVVFHPAAVGKLEKAAVRLEERYLGGRTPEASVIARWNVAATEVVRLQLTDIKVKRQQLQRADEILREIQADAFAYLSDTSPLGFDQRLGKFGERLADFVSDRAPSVDRLQESRNAIRAHDLAARETRRVERVEMALRLARWRAQMHTMSYHPPVSLLSAAQNHLRHGGFIDWARLSLRAGDPVRELSEAYSRLFDDVTELRDREAQHFARLLTDWTAAGSSGDEVIVVERILEQILAPLAAKRPVLVIVIDGMSVSVARELIADLARHEWMTLCEAGRNSSRPGLATIPSVTEFSRTSLLCGRLRQGSASEESAGFAQHPALVEHCRNGYPPILFHKVALQESDDAGLAADVRKEIASERRRIVGVVVNAVDDHLLKGEQLDTRWSLDEIKVLPALLYEARIARRLVMLVSDHGHVLDCQAKGRQYEVCGERWRAATSDPAADELVVEGERVLTAGHRLIAPWSEGVRYGVKKNGYHGGLTPQEMVVPIVVLTSTDDFPEGWQEQAVDTPSWWDDVVIDSKPKPQPVPKLKPIRPEPARPLLDRLEDDEPFVPSPAVTKTMPEWVARLLASTVFVEQKRLGGRGLPVDDMITRLLATLDQRGGKMTSTALARALEFPTLRLPGLLAKVQRVLNIDGYAVLNRDDASDTVELNRALLLKQFDLV